MAMRDFLDGSCGQNPALKVASQFTRDTFQNEGHRQALSHPQDALGAPTTFRMDNLLKEMQALEPVNSGPPVLGPQISELASHNAWTEEYLSQRPDNIDLEFSKEGSNMQGHELHLDSVWDVERQNTDRFLPPHVGYIKEYNPVMMIDDSLKTPKELLDDSKWVSEMLQSESSQDFLEKTELMSTAENFLMSVSDPKIKASDFMKYVEKLSTGEIGVDGKSAHDRSEEWSNEFENNARMESLKNSNLWADEFITSNGEIPNRTKETEDFWQKLNAEWERLATEEAEKHPWLQDQGSFSNTKEYHFTEENSFEDIEDALAEGKKKLIEGDIPSAVLLFEEAVKRDPDNPDAWTLLGTTQSLNEQDLQSIAALHKALDINPNNLVALMSLASSLANESFNRQACDALKKWVSHNDKYSHLLQGVNTDGNSLSSATSILHPQELENMKKVFIEAARMNPVNAVDADIQCGLGILFCLEMDYDKAVDCFRSAIGVHPENPLLWNRLGASLANCGKSSDAVGAYREALKLSPGYIRARYNLGIACVNLGAYREAAEHFLTALNIQAKGKANLRVRDEPNKVNMSDTVWSSLRSSLHLMDLPHLSRFVDARDLNALNREFRLESVS